MTYTELSIAIAQVKRQVGILEAGLAKLQGQPAPTPGGIPAPHPTPDDLVARQARQAAVSKCNEASRASTQALLSWHLVTPAPKLQDWLDDPNYVWEGWSILAAHGGALNPRAI